MSEPTERKVVCAAIRSSVDGTILCGVRHFDNIMQCIIQKNPSRWHKPEQGFIDQFCQFMTREEAYQVASKAGQIIRKVGGDSGKLFSENLY